MTFISNNSVPLTGLGISTRCNGSGWYVLARRLALLMESAL
jgi:hypothetical protein